MSQPIETMLGSGALLVAARAIVSSFFFIAGVFGVFNFNVIVQEMQRASLGAPRTLAAATIITQLVGSILLITNLARLAWFGAGALGVFTLLCIPLGHPFWRFHEPQRSTELYIALEHVALTGGLLLAAIASR